jgi:competence protein ComEA
MNSLTRGIYVVLLVMLSTLVSTAAFAAEKKADARATVIDLNMATTDELEALPGIGPAIAKKIVDNRPYARKNELVDRNIVSKSTYDKIKSKVVARGGSAVDGKNDRPSASVRSDRPASADGTARRNRGRT